MPSVSVNGVEAGADVCPVLFCSRSQWSSSINVYPGPRVMGQESGLRQDRWLFNEGPRQPKFCLPTRLGQSPSGAITFYALIKQPGPLLYRWLGFGWPGRSGYLYSRAAR